MKDLSTLPSVDCIVTDSQIQPLLREFGRSFTLTAVRAVLEDIRSEAWIGVPELPEIIQLSYEKLRHWATSSLSPVVNATGVILHTNLGRAPLSPESIRAISGIAIGYSNLEFDLSTGKRGSRTRQIASQLTLLSGAEQALVVNNNASAVLLVLSALANRKQVLIARSQLVEIGGGFRIPDVMRQSGAKLIPPTRFTFRITPKCLKPASGW